ncbi:MAG: nucleotide exchange factor GrpE [Micromonosporaceae bacterium]
MGVQPNSGNAAVAAAAESSDHSSPGPPGAGSGDHRTPAPTAAGQPPTSPERSELLGQLHAISAQLGILTERESQRAAHREAVIDRLHAENQTLRRRELDLMLDPVRNGLYRLYDLVRREADRWSGDVAPGPEHAAPLLDLIAEEVAEVLARTGVEPFTARPGEPYDAARHRPVDAEDVVDAASEGTVLRALTSGFANGEQITRRADVVVGQPSRRTRSDTDNESR